MRIVFSLDVQFARGKVQTRGTTNINLILKQFSKTKRIAAESPHLYPEEHLLVETLHLFREEHLLVKTPLPFPGDLRSDLKFSK